jgi:hypothetical protein
MKPWNRPSFVSVVAVIVAFATVGQPVPASAAPAATVSATPELFPQFDPDISDYVVRCDGSTSIQLQVNATAGTTVSVNGAPSRSGSFTQGVARQPNQSFSIVLQESGSQSTHTVRCLPADFPQFTVERNGAPQAQWQLGLVGPIGDNPAIGSYVVFFDDHGVPVWWKNTGRGSMYATLFDNGNLGIASRDLAHEETLLGEQLATIEGVNGEFDLHELVKLPNGNFLIITNVDTPNFDLTSIGGDANATIMDQEFQEVTPDGDLVWTWRSSDHIGAEEFAQQWWQTALTRGAPYDVYHANSIEADGDSIIVSYRHLNAIYRINRVSNGIEWKLGGTTRAESLTTVDDPLPSLVGQHDPRVYSDGTVTVHDNQTNAGHPPRAVRYDIDAGAKTATLMESVTDAAAPSSICCGSARKLPTGNWVTTSGLNPFITELTSAGQPVLRVRFTGSFMYRVEPLMPGRVDAADLRAAMDQKHPAPVDSEVEEVPAPDPAPPSTPPTVPVQPPVVVNEERETRSDPGRYSVVDGKGNVIGFETTTKLTTRTPPAEPLDLIAPIVGRADTPSGNGHWLVAADGGVFAFGDAQFFGSLGGRPLNAPIVGIAATPSGDGYWLVGADGGVFAFGDAAFLGSMGGTPLNAPIIGIAATASGNGYVLGARDGGVFTFGDAQFHGSMGGEELNRPVVAVQANGNDGYWLVADDGGVFNFGTAGFHGSAASLPLNAPVIGLVTTATGDGYWLAASDGGIFAFGDAPFLGSVPATGNSIVAISRTN